MIDFSIALEQFEIFLLILMRIATFVYAAPFFNTTNTPQRVKIGFAFCLSLLVYPMLGQVSFEYNNIVEYTTLVVKEVVVGLMLGFVASMVVQIVQFAGKIIDMDMGLAMATIYDPQTRNQVGIMGNFYYYILMLSLIVTGLYQYLVRAIVETFTVVPLGEVKVNVTLYDTVLQFMADYVIIGFRIALPIFAAALLTNCVLGILARIAPQMNMFVIGVQLRIIGGLAVLMVIMYMFPSITNYVNGEIKHMVSMIIGGMT